MEKRIIPITLGNDKLRHIISEIIETSNNFGNLEFQLTNKNDLNFLINSSSSKTQLKEK